MKKIRFLLACLLAFSVSVASASVVLQGTRIIYPSNSKDASINVDNAGQQPVMVQAWLDRDDDPESLDKNKVPFVITPPIFRINPAKSQRLRIIYNQDPLPEDRESVFWLNVLEIPAVLENGAKKNMLDISFRTRIKMFFRPSALDGNLRKAASGAKWGISKVGDAVNVSVENNSPYYLTISKVVITANGEEYSANGEMVSPFKSISLPLDALKSTEGVSKISYSFIDDYGSVIAMEAKLIN